ncbi:MAG: ABC transporter ATP-binding protein [SAR324 cluster bacterium]|nr:ABC transporter ATP-binding protein [SAR324 cluster bacterium]
MEFLKIDNIKKNYNQTVVLKNISLTLGKGNFLVLVGPSGCGKTTLLNIIAGLDVANEGKIYIKNNDVTNLLPSQRDIAMVFQSYALYPNMTVKGNISFGLKMRKTPKKIIDEKIEAVANILQISHLLNRKPSQLSGGQRQRVAMGRAIVRDPQIFLFDEPLSNLDAKLRVEIRSEIKKLHQRLKATIVYVTHDQIEALTLADYIAVMNQGEIKQFGTPDDIYNHPANLFTAGFIGSTSINFMDIILKKDGDNYKILVGKGLNSVSITYKSPKNKMILDKYINKELILGVRPEDISLVENTKNKSTSFNKKIEDIEIAGSDSYIELNLDDKKVIARIDAKLKLQVNKAYDFLFSPDHIHLFDPKTKNNILYP